MLVVLVVVRWNAPRYCSCSSCFASLSPRRRVLVHVVVAHYCSRRRRRRRRHRLHDDLVIPSHRCVLRGVASFVGLNNHKSTRHSGFHRGGRERKKKEGKLQ